MERVKHEKDLKLNFIKLFRNCDKVFKKETCDFIINLVQEHVHDDCYACLNDYNHSFKHHTCIYNTPEDIEKLQQMYYELVLRNIYRME